MRVLSPHGQYAIQVAPAKETRQVDNITGEAYTLVERQPIVADFEMGGVTPAEEALALVAFDGNWGALPEGVNPVTRIGVWDSDKLSVDAEDRKKIEERVRILAQDRPTFMIVVDDNIKAPKPWGHYDTMDADEILAYVQVLGLDAAVIAQYERENQERPELIEGLEALAAGKEEVATVSV